MAPHCLCELWRWSWPHPSPPETRGSCTCPCLCIPARVHTRHHLLQSLEPTVLDACSAPWSENVEVTKHEINELTIDSFYCKTETVVHRLPCTFSQQFLEPPTQLILYWRHVLVWRNADVKDLSSKNYLDEQLGAPSGYPDTKTVNEIMKMNTSESK